MKYATLSRPFQVTQVCFTLQLSGALPVLRWKTSRNKICLRLVPDTDTFLLTKRAERSSRLFTGEQSREVCSATGGKETSPPEPSGLMPKQRWLFGREILHRTLVTVAVLIIVRCGSFIPTPGVDPLSLQLTSYSDFGPTAGTIQQLFQPSAEVPANVCIIGITPIILANIAVSAMYAAAKLNLGGVDLFPAMAQYVKEKQKDPYGVMHLEVFRNVVVFVFIAILSIAKAIELQPYAFAFDHFVLRTAWTYIAVSAVIKHLSMEIDDYGLGQGLSFLLALNIINGLLTNLTKAKALVSEGLLPVPAQLAFASIFLLLICGSVLVSRVQLKLNLRYYGDSKPPLEVSTGSSAKAVRLGGTTVQLVQSKDSQSYLQVPANPNGIQPLQTASIAASFIQQLAALAFPALVYSSAWNFAFMPLLVGVIAMVCNIFDGSSRAEVASTYMSQVNCKVIGIAPGSIALDQLRRLFLTATAAGGIAIAFMATVANFVDNLFMASYGISAGCSGLLLMTNLVVTILKQVEEIRAKQTVNKKYERESTIIPQDMPLIGEKR